MRAFCASIATETNTFSPLRTDFADFAQSFYAPPGEHPETPTLCSAVFPALRARAATGEIELIEGTATWAEPGGLLNRHTWERLRDEVLGQVREALPLDVVILGLHGAMIADGCVDCEGELIAAVRSIVGPETKIGVTFDPHSHLSAQRVANADVIVVFKEFPHTDFVKAGEDCVDLILKAARGEIRPEISVWDARMIDIFLTSREPMRGFVDRLQSMEDRGDVLSVSVIHGFMAGDSPDLGAKILVVTDGDKAKGDQIARHLGRELFSLRGQAQPEFLTPEEALDRASAADATPVVMADVWDNPGGGVAGDSTILLSEVLRRGMSDVAVGTIWDPMAVRLCFAAGEGAELDLRFGGKTSAHAGDPIDARVTVTKLRRDTVQRFGASLVPLGDCAAIRIGGVDIVLNTNRSQAFSPDIFDNLGIEAVSRKILIVKSTNHFHGAFSPIAAEILYVAVDGPYPSKPEKTRYRRLTRPMWPIVANPHAEEAAE
ncbi:MAG: M81 family metallopeptidase [Rhizobiaceae bacterium]|nr:M81 family metallopeptidase [Rhizobiaceae bacterium]